MYQIGKYVILASNQSMTCSVKIAGLLKKPHQTSQPMPFTQLLFVYGHPERSWVLRAKSKRRSKGGQVWRNTVRGGDKGTLAKTGCCWPERSNYCAVFVLKIVEAVDVAQLQAVALICCLSTLQHWNSWEATDQCQPEVVQHPLPPQFSARQLKQSNVQSKTVWTLLFLSTILVPSDQAFDLQMRSERWVCSHRLEVKVPSLSPWIWKVCASTKSQFQNVRTHSQLHVGVQIW